MAYMLNFHNHSLGRLRQHFGSTDRATFPQQALPQRRQRLQAPQGAGSQEGPSSSTAEQASSTTTAAGSKSIENVLGRAPARTPKGFGPQKAGSSSRSLGSPPSPPQVASEENREPGAKALPAVTRDAVFRSCLGTSAAIALLGLLLRAAAPVISVATFGSDPSEVQDLLTVPWTLSVQHVGIALAAAGGVTAARTVLLGLWPEFAESSARSNKQVLSPLSIPLDLAWVAVLPAVSEEFLFRGALIPGTCPDWRGVLASGIVFGLLHNSGGRGLSFAAWASAVGTVYGASFLATHDIFVPMAAHALSNLASAALYLKDQQQKQ